MKPDFERLRSEHFLDGKDVVVYGGDGPVQTIYNYELPVPHSTATLDVFINDAGTVILSHGTRRFTIESLAYNEEEDEFFVQVGMRLR